MRGILTRFGGRSLSLSFSQVIHRAALKMGLVVTLSDVLKAAKSGNRPATLEALRDRLAETIDSPMTTGAELASLARQLVIVTELLEDINEGVEVNLVDSLAARRAERVANSDPSRHSTDSNQLGGS